MSNWASLDAEFWPTKNPNLLAIANVEENLPKGSETGPSVRKTNGRIYVSGRLRDMNDVDSPGVLAWFVSNAQWSSKATLELDFDYGPKYRYEWEKGALIKLKGILDL